jgi:hypothetical protein
MTKPFPVGTRFKLLYEKRGKHLYQVIDSHGKDVSSPVNLTGVETYATEVIISENEKFKFGDRVVCKGPFGERKGFSFSKINMIIL